MPVASVTAKTSFSDGDDCIVFMHIHQDFEVDLCKAMEVFASIVKT